MSLAKGAAFPAANTSQASTVKILRDQRNKQRQMREEIKARVEHLTSEVVNEYFLRKPHRTTPGEFAQFPTTELARAMKMA